MFENQPRYLSYGPNFVVGDWNDMIGAHLQNDEVAETDGQDAASIHWSKVEESFLSRGYKPSEFAALSDATLEELICLRAGLDANIEVEDD